MTLLNVINLDKIWTVKGPISPKITRKTENNTVECYQFRSNLDSKFYVR